MSASKSLQVVGHSFAVLADANGVEHVKIQDLAGPFGLDHRTQLKRLKDTGWATVAKITTVRNGGKQALFSCLPLEQVPMYFATLSPGHVNEAFRPALVQMQREVAKAVGDYYTKGGAIKGDALPSQLIELRDQINAILRHDPCTDAIWPDAFVRRYAAWHGQVWLTGTSAPFSMKSANGFFYRMIFPLEVYEIIKREGLRAGVKYHQVIADAPRDYLKQQLRIATILADECGSEVEWRQRMRRAFGKTNAAIMGQRSLSL